MTVAADSATGAASLVQSVDWLAVAPPSSRRPWPSSSSSPTSSWGNGTSRSSATGPSQGSSPHSRCSSRCGPADRSTFCLTDGSQACSYTADHFALVIQALVLGGALLTALLSIGDTRKLPAA